MASEPDFQPQLRLHPLSWLFVLLAHVRHLIVPIATFVFVGVRRDNELWGLITIVPLLVIALWHQWIYRYGFGPRGLVIQDGLFFRNVRQIEYARIENIDVERGVLHRLFGVALVSIATSTGGKPEASIRVLSLDAVQELRDRIFARAARVEPQTPEVAAPRDEVLLHLSPGELVRYGLIDNRGMFVVAALVGFLYQGGMFELMRATVSVWLTDSRLNEFAALGIAMKAALVVATLVAFLASVRVLSIALAMVTLFDFTLTRHEHDFRIRHGLLTRIALNLRVRRIQSVHQTATLLHRWFNRVSVRADLAGDSGAGQGEKQHSQGRTHWLAPVCLPQQASALIDAALPDADLRGEPDWQPLAPGARARLFRRSVYVLVVLAVLAVVALHTLPGARFRVGVVWTAVALLVLVPIAWLRAHIYVRYTRWALTADAILFRHGWLTRRLVIAPRNRLQSVRLSSSPFDRRYGMASVSLDTAGAGGGRDNIHIRLLPLEVAQHLAAELYHSRVDAVPIGARRATLASVEALSGGPR